jgi:predicted DNA binding protein
MRRLVLEFSLDELRKRNSKNLDVSRLQNVQRLEILQLLRQDRKEFAGIVRIKLENQESDIENYVRLVVGNPTTNVQILDREKDGAYIAFVKHRTTLPPFTSEIMKAGVYTISREIQEGKLKLTFLGSVGKLRRALENLRKLKMHFKVISLTDARFSSDSLLGALTEKQRKVLITAYKLGYYNLPRKIDSEQLAKRLNLKRSTLVVHRRKAELRIISKILTE